MQHINGIIDSWADPVVLKSSMTKLFSLRRHNRHFWSFLAFIIARIRSLLILLNKKTFTLVVYCPPIKVSIVTLFHNGATG